MAETTKIAWTDATWNIARGCTKVDEDCKYCYMYRESFNNSRYNPIEVIKTKTVFNLPLTIKEPAKIFTCSLTDFYHESCDTFRDDAWEIIRKCPRHTFQILTKRPERITENTPPDLLKAKNIWFGTSVGSQKGVQRIDTLLNVNCKTKFISFEPLHERIDHLLDFSNLQKISWVIIGGESGNDTGKYRYRRCDLTWIRNIVNMCGVVGTPVFVKQLGTHLAKELKLKNRHGADIEDFPTDLQIQEYPNNG